MVERREGGKRYESCEQGRGILEACGGYKKCDLVESGGNKVDSCVRVVVLLMFVYNNTTVLNTLINNITDYTTISFFTTWVIKSRRGSDKAGPRPVNEPNFLVNRTRRFTDTDTHLQLTVTHSQPKPPKMGRGGRTEAATSSRDTKSTAACGCSPAAPASRRGRRASPREVSQDLRM